MSFQFNFPDPSNGLQAEQLIQETESQHGPGDNVEECQEIFKNTNWELEIPTVVYNISDDLCLTCLDNQEVENKLCRSRSNNSGVVKAAESHSDLIPNVYEGGLKVWECAIDLVRYLHENHVSFEDNKVLELGCGAGLPGILAVLKGAQEVHFQDYNPEVLQHYTIPNVAVNLKDTAAGPTKCRCRYFSGDWTLFNDHIAKEILRCYDVILTAETIYKPDNYRKLTHFFNSHLSRYGRVYVAAKSNYFGVGGGTKDFKEFLDRESVFEVQDSITVEADIPREILVLKRRQARKKRKQTR